MLTIDQTDAASLTKAELEGFAALILAAGEVQAEGLPALVASAPVLIRVRRGDTLLGVAGLKVPRPAYRKYVFAAAGVSEAELDFSWEFGWASVLEDERGAGIGSLIAKAAVAAAVGQKGVFATCRLENEAIQNVLNKVGFEPMGEPYMSKRGPYHNRLLGLKKIA